MTSAQKERWKNEKRWDTSNIDRLRIVTAGSVDDGKSTLLGHLMAQCGALKVDQLATIQDKSQRLGYDYLDYSLATDGLLSEREQGITFLICT
jgi:sulfate adenylyltransferase subunit 1